MKLPYQEHWKAEKNINMNVIGKFSEEVEQTASEIVKDVKDSVGEMIEQNITPQPTPQPFDSAQGRQKRADEQKQLAYTRRYLQNLQMAQTKVRQENKQKEQQRLQNQQQEKQVSEIKKEEKKKKPVNPAIAYAGKVEFKRGIGG